MTATADQISQVRRMTNELTIANYSDLQIQAYIEACPLTDKYGYSQDDPNELFAINPDWTPTYDLNAAAAHIWEEKAGVLAGDFDFSADGGNYSRSQAYEMAMKQTRYYISRRSHKTMTMQSSPKMPIQPDELDSDETN